MYPYEIFPIPERYVETFRGTRTYTFPGRNVERSTNHSEPPSETMFKKSLTKLKIEVIVHAGDVDTQSEIIFNRRLFKDEHSGHGTHLSLETTNRKTQSYCISYQDSVPWMFHPVFYWLCALLAMSLPHRCLIYFNVGHIKFTIKKRVFKQPPSTTTIPVPPTEPTSVAPARPQELPSTPSKEHPLQQIPPESPPPDYDTACSMLNQGPYDVA